MPEVKVIDLLMCLNGKLYSDCFKVFYGSSITSLIDFVLVMGKHRFRGAMLSGDSSCCVYSKPQIKPSLELNFFTDK